MRYHLILFLALLSPSIAPAQGPIRFARTPDVSPDGRTVVFSYLGDLWTVDSAGGVARPLTMHEAHDYHPAFSPDGKWIAFSSNRMGSYDVFVIAAQGGKPRRLTFDSAQDVVTGWTPDGQSILFSSTRGTSFPSTTETYTIGVNGGVEKRIAVREAKDAALSRDGKRFAVVRGPGTWYRKGYRGSSNDDIWIGASDNSFIHRLTDFNGQDTSPMWSPDGKKLYYVSERFATPANIVAQEISPDGKAIGEPQQITKQKDDGVRKARLSGNGEWFVYECGGDLLMQSVKGESWKIAIEAYADDKTNTDRTTTYTRDATEYSLSPDEKFATITVHGEIFLTKVPDGGKSTQLTKSPALDHGVAWAPDGKSIIFLSDRSGHEDLYSLEPDDVEHPTLTTAHQFKVKQLTNSPEAESAATFSPDGKRIVFMRSGKLWSMNPDATDLKAIVDQSSVMDYDWSPDGKWIVYARSDPSYASEMYIIASTGGEPKNVTRYATSNMDVTWSQTGNRIAFLSNRRQTTNIYLMSLQKPTAPNAPASNDIDFDDIHLRVARVTSQTADHVAVSPDGGSVAFRSGTGREEDLWLSSANGSVVTRLTGKGQAPKQIRWAKKSSGLIYFLNGAGEFCYARTALAGILGPTGPAGDPAKVLFTAKLQIRESEEFAEMFDQAWRLLGDQFYDAKYHGVSWDAVRSKYRPMVADIGSKEDLYALISLMLGELNASHLGITGAPRTADEQTADLGLLFDDSFAGPGLKIAEIVKRGTADKRGLNLKTGDVIVAIDRTDLKPDVNISQLLNGKVGEMVALEIADPAAPKGRRRVEILAVSRQQMGPLMYDRWVERNEAMVAQMSNGTIGYIHIPSMDEDGLERFVRHLYSDNFDKDAILLDVRFNGGGFTHDQVLAYLTGKPHTFFRRRDGSEGMVMRNFDRKWSKPLAVLINNRSYSDAEIFPAAFRTLNLGKVIGQPTGGYVIGTTNGRLIDGSQFRLPRTGVFTVKGVNMEKEGVQPDILVEVSPEDSAQGLDPQIRKGIEVLRLDADAWKKVNTPVTGTGGNSGNPGGQK